MMRGVLSLGARTCSLHRRIILEASVKESQPAVADSVRFRFGGLPDLDMLATPEFGYDTGARSFAYERLLAGDRLVVGESPSGIVFYGWIMFGQMDLGYRKYQPIAPDYAYSYKLYTVPQNRGRGICRAYYSWLRGEAGKLGLRRLMAWVEARNRPSLEAHRRSGFQPVGTFWQMRFLFRYYYHVSPRILTRLLEPSRCDS